MKLALLFLSVLVSLPLPAATPPLPHPFAQGADLDGYSLAWSDEFDGDGLDLAKWDYRTDSKKASTQLPANVTVADGTLRLNLKKEAAGDKAYTGAGVISKKLFGFGYYEARMKMPPGGGWHTSFWLMRHDGSGGTNPQAAPQELDVIEQDSIHRTSYAVNIHKWQGGHVSFGGKAVKSSDLSADFHIFGCEFTPTTVRYFLDGEMVKAADLTNVTDPSGKKVEFHPGEQNIWLTSIAYPQGKAGVEDGKLPAAAEVDYVRFFQRP